MNGKRVETYRNRLRELLTRVGGTAAALEAEVRVPTGGEASGGLSNAPMHLGDVGSDVYAQELSATLLDNESRLQNEIRAALDRIAAGTFGRCERCDQAILAERLDALPYVRYCVPCAEAVGPVAAANFNDGRPRNWPGEYNPRQDGSEAELPSRADDRAAFTRLKGNAADRGDDRADTHAAGTPGGGSALGGLAGTTLGRGDPADAGLEYAMGSGNFDAAVEEDEDDTTAYSGPSGGAVGGTPADKRASGGRSDR